MPGHPSTHPFPHPPSSFPVMCDSEKQQRRTQPSLWSDQHTLVLLIDGWQDAQDHSDQAAKMASSNTCVENQCLKRKVSTLGFVLSLCFSSGSQTVLGNDSLWVRGTPQTAPTPLPFRCSNIACFPKWADGIPESAAGVAPGSLTHPPPSTKGDGPRTQ